MEAGAAKVGSPQREPSEDLPPDAPDGLRAAANGEDAAKKVSGAEEHSAVAFLLGQQRAPKYKVPVQFDTDVGTLTLQWTIRALDGKTIDRIERANTDDSKGPLDPDAVDDLRANAELVAEATVQIEDATGAVTKVNDPDFLNGLVSGADALMARFHWQSGLLTGMASQVRRASGWAPDRIGEATRVMVDAAGNSSSGRESSG